MTYHLTISLRSVIVFQTIVSAFLSLTWVLEDFKDNKYLLQTLNF